MTMGSIVKRSLAMALREWSETIANACGLDDATPAHVTWGKKPAREPLKLQIRER